MMKRKLCTLLVIVSFFSSCHKASDDDLPIIIRLENLTGKEIAAATFIAVQPNNRSQFEYLNIGVNSVSEYAVQTETDFSKSILIEYNDGSRTAVEHPWVGTDHGRLKPDAGKYTYRLVALNGNSLDLMVQSRRD